MPILGELYELLRQSQDTRRLANIINRLVNGSARSFNQPTNVSLDNKYTVLDISSPYRRHAGGGNVRGA